jgi:hypothetical protein
MMSDRNLIKVGSTSLFTIIFRAMPLINRIDQIPMMKSKKAAINLGE